MKEKKLDTLLDEFIAEFARTMDVETTSAPDDINEYAPDASDFDQTVADYNECYSLL